MRTQPYDLLSWSAAYFRCIANDIQPPTKSQFEQSTDQMIESRSLTKEYLKVLVKQVNFELFITLGKFNLFNSTILGWQRVFH